MHENTLWKFTKITYFKDGNTIFNEMLLFLNIGNHLYKEYLRKVPPFVVVLIEIKAKKKFRYWNRKTIQLSRRLLRSRVKAKRTKLCQKVLG